MKLSDLFSGAQMNNTASQVKQPQMETPNARMVQQANRQIQSLSPGQTIQGEVVARNGNEVQIKVSDNVVLNARVDQNMQLELGKTMTFEVRNNGKALTLSPLFANTAMDANILKALGMAALPVNQTTVEMTGLMMRAGLAIDRNSLQQIFREVNTFRGSDVANIVDLHRLGLPVSEENLTQIASYKNLTHQLVDGMNTVLEALPETMQEMLREGNTEGAARMFQELLQLVRETPTPADAAADGGGLQPNAAAADGGGSQPNAAAVDGGGSQPNAAAAGGGGSRSNAVAVGGGDPLPNGAAAPDGVVPDEGIQDGEVYGAENSRQDGAATVDAQYNGTQTAAVQDGESPNGALSGETMLSGIAQEETLVDTVTTGIENTQPNGAAVPDGAVLAEAVLNGAEQGKEVPDSAAQADLYSVGQGELRQDAAVSGETAQSGQAVGEVMTDGVSIRETLPNEVPGETAQSAQAETETPDGRVVIRQEQAAGQTAAGSENGRNINGIPEADKNGEAVLRSVETEIRETEEIPERIPLSQKLETIIRSAGGAAERYNGLLQQLDKAEQSGNPAEQADVLQRLIQQGLADKNQPLLRKIIANRDVQKFLKEGLSKLWTIKPEEVADRGKVDELYQRLDRQLKSLNHMLEQGGKTDSPAGRAVNNMTQNLDFLQQLNQVYTYVQLPLRMQQGETNGDLYVYTNKRNLASKDGQISALLHLDMEHLGPVDVYVAMQAEKVSTRFYVQDDEMLDFLEEHMDILTERLQKRGYVCTFAMQVRDREEEPESGLNGLMSQEKGQPIVQYAFDMRA